MDRKVRQLGEVKLVQLQPNGLIIDMPGQTPTGQFYDPSRLVQVDHLLITPLGIEATLPDGTHILDIHHIDHPGKAYDEDDLVSIGFTSHYDAMRNYFGNHMIDGIAGENIIIDYTEEIWSADLSPELGIENQETSELAILKLQRFASPCAEFSQFCIQNQYKKPPANQMRQTLDFLAKGRRGFLLVLSKTRDEITVRPGDKVFVLADD